MSQSLPSDTPRTEEKREIKPWMPKEKELFYEGFNKFYKKFNQISELVGFTKIMLLISRSRHGQSLR